MENTILSSAMTVCASSVELNFLVDELLDFPTEFEEELLSSPFIAKSGEASLLHNAPPPLHHPDVMSSNDMPHVKFVDISSATTIEEPSSGLCVPPDELVHQLEWLSSFNDDDCFMEGDTKLLPLTESTSSTRASSDIRVDRCTKEIQMTSRKSRESFNSQSPVSVLEQGSHSYRKPCRMARAYKSHRVRKTRTGGRIWSLDILKPILVNKRAKDAYKRTSLLVTSSSSQAYSESLCPFLREDVLERPFKKMKRVAAEADSGLVRRCTHCLVQKTPQWRAGPQGPKTLCNACGVRYKSGRLVPEYRPAASPSFVSEVHSNSHRRILEMRRAKDVESCVRLYNNKVESREEADEIEAGGPYASHGSCEESMGCKELCVSKGGLLYKEAMPGCKQVEVRGDDGSCTTDDSASGKEFATKGNPEGSACDAVEIDASTCVEESVLVDVRGVQHGSDVSREGCWSVRVGS